MKRNLDATQKLSAAQKVAPMVEVPFFHEFLGDILMEHQAVHWLFGAGDECTACAMATGYSPDDPIFMMLHGFTAYLRALWASCHGYDNIDPLQLDNHPEAFTAECIDGYDECGAIELDAAYKFGAMVDAEWSLTATQQITPRSLWDFSAWNVKYDHGTFYDESGLRNSPICKRQNIENSAWFTKLSEAPSLEHPHKTEAERSPQFGAKEAAHPLNMADAAVSALNLISDHSDDRRENVQRAMEAMDAMDAMQGVEGMDAPDLDRERAAEQMSVKYRVKAIPVPKPGNTATVLMLCSVLLCGAVYMLYGSNLWEFIATRIKMKNAHIASPYKYDTVNANDIDADDEMYGAIEL